MGDKGDLSGSSGVYGHRKALTNGRNCNYEMEKAFKFCLGNYFMISSGSPTGIVTVFLFFLFTSYALNLIVCVYKCEG